MKVKIITVFVLMVLGVSSSFAQTPSFYGDWETGLVTGSGIHNWGGIESVAADRFTVINNGTARQGNYYARVEVLPGDDPFKGYTTERAEVSGPNGGDGQDWRNQIYENTNSGIQQYSFSVRFDPSWQTIYDTGGGAWGIFLQLHGPDGASPVWALSATDSIRLNRQTSLTNSLPNTTHFLTNGSLNKGKWIDLIVTVKYAADKTGFITIQRRDEGQTSFAEVLNLQNIMTLKNDKDHYMKFGLYRNAMPFTSILYLDGYTRTAVPNYQPGNNHSER